LLLTAKVLSTVFTATLYWQVTRQDKNYSVF
jgi:hypothetical protein